MGDRFILPPPMGPLPDEPLPCVFCDGSGRRGLELQVDDERETATVVPAGEACPSCGGTGHAVRP